MERTFPIPHIWVPQWLRKRQEGERVKAAGLVNGGLVNDGHAMVNAGVIRAHTTLAPPLPNPMFWLRSDLNTYTDTGLTTAAVNDADVVKGWGDLSGNARNATEATNPPILKLNQINGFPSVRFDGTNDRLTATFTLNQPYSVYIVVKQITWTSNDAFLAGQTGDNYSLIQSAASPNIRNWAGAGTSTQNGDLAVGSWGIVANIFDSAGWIRVNAGSTAGSISPTTADRGGMTIGAHPAPTSFCNMEIAELLLYNGATARATRRPSATT